MTEVKFCNNELCLLFTITSHNVVALSGSEAELGGITATYHRRDLSHHEREDNLVQLRLRAQRLDS